MPKKKLDRPTAARSSAGGRGHRRVSAAPTMMTINVPPIQTAAIHRAVKDVLSLKGVTSRERIAAIRAIETAHCSPAQMTITNCTFESKP